MTRARRLAVVAAGTVLAGWAATRAVPAHAYSCIATNCAPHCDSPVPYALGRGSDDLGDSESERQVRAAMEAWANVPCTSLRVEYRGRTQEAPSRGNAVVAWNETSWSFGSGVIGVTTSVSGGRCLRASMQLNGVNYTWVTGPPRMGRQVNTFSIVAHEGGHYLGLGHTSAQGALMAASYAGGVIPIGPDDQRGICRIYAGGDGGAVDSPDGSAGDMGDAGAPERPLLPPPDAEPVLMPAPDAPDAEGPGGPEPMPGEPEPMPGGAAGPGERCQVNEDCQTNLCVSLGTRAFCTRPCAGDDECDDGYTCADRGDLGLCLPRLAPLTGGGAPAGPGGGGTVTSGCSFASGVGHGGGRRAWLPGAGLLVVMLLRRARARRR